MELWNKNAMKGTDSVVLHKGKYRFIMENKKNTVDIIKRRLNTYSGLNTYSCSHEYSLTVERKYFSRSLTDLTGVDRTQELSARHMGSLSIRALSNMQFPLADNKVAREAGRCVTHLLMLHAWRSRRLEVHQSETLLNGLNNQVESLNLQVYALRELLKNEKIRRDLAVKEMCTKKVESERERNTILQEKEKLKYNLKEFLDLIVKMKQESEIQKNHIKAAERHAENWRLRFNEEKKNSDSLKDITFTLGQEIKAKDGKIEHQTMCLNDLYMEKSELEELLNNHIKILKKKTEEINSKQEKLKLSEELRKQQERFLMEKDEEINQLRAQIALMEEKLLEQDERNGELAKLISDKTKELVLLHDKLGELTKNERFWLNRAIKMASKCTRIPIACFYALATLLLPQPSYCSM